MDMNAEIHPSRWARICYRALWIEYHGTSNMKHLDRAIDEAVAAGDLLPIDKLFERPTISLRHWTGMLNVGLKAYGDDLPDLLMRHSKFEHLGMVAAYLATSPSMRAVLTGFSLHYPNVDPNLGIEVQQAKGGIEFAVYYHHLEGHIGACFNGSACAMIKLTLESVASMQVGEGQHLTIHASKPPGHRKYEKHMQMPVKWELRPDGKLGNTIFIPDAVLDRPSVLYNANMYEYMNRFMWDNTTKMNEVTGAATTVASLVAVRLSTSIKVPTQSAVASHYKWTTRTLQKKLKDEGSSWQSLLDAEIIKRAKIRLSNGDSVEAVAEYLGISVSNFRRKFKALTGNNPRPFTKES